MSRRMLMATVAALALAVPAAAQEQPKPQLDTEQEATQPLEQAQEPVQDQSAPGRRAGDTAGRPSHRANRSRAAARSGRGASRDAGGARSHRRKGGDPAAGYEFIQVQDEAQFLADEEVIGKDVVNIMDEEVGTIADLVMDQDQKLVGVVLSVGGFLGIADKWVAVPVDQIDFPTAEQPARLLVAVTEEQLKNAPDFTTRAAVEAEAEAERAQEGMQQQQQIPPPATTNQ